jgi:hypothetical protein
MLIFLCGDQETHTSVVAIILDFPS